MRRPRTSGQCCGPPIQMAFFTEASGFLAAWQSRSSGQTWLAFPLKASNSRSIGMVAKCLRSETWAAAKCSGLSTEARLPGAICPGLAARLLLLERRSCTSTDCGVLRRARCRIWGCCPAFIVKRCGRALTGPLATNEYDSGLVLALAACKRVAHVRRGVVQAHLSIHVARADGETTIVAAAPRSHVSLHGVGSNFVRLGRHDGDGTAQYMIHTGSYFWQFGIAGEPPYRGQDRTHGQGRPSRSAVVHWEAGVHNRRHGATAGPLQVQCSQMSGASMGCRKAQSRLAGRRESDRSSPATAVDLVGRARWRQFRQGFATPWPQLGCQCVGGMLVNLLSQGPQLSLSARYSATRDAPEFLDMAA